MWICEDVWSNNNKTSHILLYIRNAGNHGLKLQFSGKALTFFQLHSAKVTEQYILYALRATQSTVDNIRKNLKSVTMPILPSMPFMSLLPILMFISFPTSAQIQVPNRILLAGRNQCSCFLQLVVNKLYWSWDTSRWVIVPIYDLMGGPQPPGTN